MDYNLVDQRVEFLGRNFEVFSLFKHIIDRCPSNYSFLLESIGDEDKPLYSFICLEPDYLLRVKGDRVEVEDIFNERGEALFAEMGEIGSRTLVRATVDDRVENRIEALNILAKRIPQVKLARPDIFPRQVFYGGYLGYLAYDIVAPWVGFTSRAETPDLLLGLHSRVIVYDHKRGELFYIDNAVDGRWDDAREIRGALSSYKRHRDETQSAVGLSAVSFKSNTSRDEFSGMVEKAKGYILEGDIFQVVLSRKVSRRVDASGLDIYGQLRRLNPSPYMYYLNFGELCLVGSSPEALVSLNGQEITTVPIAGTRRRGRSYEDEAIMERELLTDPKERAEHVMLVDLARNDTSKVSEPGTVRTVGLMTLKKYRHVMHLTTSVQGVLRRGLTSIDVLKCVFPAGTVTGAPKLRAMEIIEELEKESRGIYAGGVGYIAFNSDMDWAITIRTIELLRREASVQAGAGIVADSQPRLEWIETENKMQSMLRAITMAEEAMS
ncbi:MAG: chorismate-binding protein [Candidatus Bathyarchaeia archaeon]